MDAATPEIGEFMMFTIYLNWGWDGCGFGEFYASKNHDTGEWTIDDECMSPESVRKILHAAVDKFVDEQLKVKREAKG